MTDTPYRAPSAAEREYHRAMHKLWRDVRDQFSGSGISASVLRDYFAEEVRVQGWEVPA